MTHGLALSQPKPSTGLITALAVLLLWTPAEAQSSGEGGTPAVRWLLDLGQADASFGRFRDSECQADSDPEAHFLACESPQQLDVSSMDAWALGFDTRIGPDPPQGAASAGAWWAGIRLGRTGPGELKAHWNAHPSREFSGTFRSDYALLHFKREFAAWAGLRPHAGVGLGVARNSSRDLQWREGDHLRQAEDGDLSGYMLRASLGLDWQAPNGMIVGLEYRYDAVDGLASGDGGSPESYPPSRASASLQTASLVFALPFGTR